MVAKRGRGQPTKYDPTFCDQAIDLGRQGYSREMIAAEFNVCWNTLLNWMDAHPDFLEAMEFAKMLEMVYFEKTALTHMIEQPQGAKLNTSLWSRSMAARFPAKYRENSKVEVSGKDDKAIQVDVVHDFAQSLMDDLLSIRQNNVKPNDR
jgi:hypothetical protein